MRGDWLYLAYADPARVWRYGLARVPAALLILGNNYLITGSPFSIGYGSNPAFPEINASNSFGFNLPNPGALADWCGANIAGCSSGARRC